jgi:hypothetical protein
LLPPLLYRYQPFSTQALANLTQRTLWFSDPSDFNDPFDCGINILDDVIDDAGAAKAYAFLLSRVTDKAAFASEHSTDGRPNDSFRAQLAKGISGHFAETLNVRRGIGCFAGRWDNLLMWAHYADGHRGFCLEFDTQGEMFQFARPVKYVAQVPRLKAADIFVDLPARDFVDAWLVTKSEHWAYEEEWRVIHTAPRTAYTYPWQSLKRVYLGAAMSEANAQIIALVLQGSGTALSRVAKDDSAFGLTATAVTFKPFDYKA